ncbi:MAG: caspase family protein [Gammaproteobacteria bacterium]
MCVGVEADADARLFAALAVERGFTQPTVLLGGEATRAAMRAKLSEMAALSEPGDLFLLTFSGHGGRTRLRVHGDESREVGTWQLYDGSLNEEQLREDLTLFRQGVRVLVVSDNCGGGMPKRASPQLPGGLEEPPALSRPAIEGFLRASVLVLAACEEGKYADGAGLPGHFAKALLRTLNGSGFDCPYDAFHRALCNGMPSYQQPDYYRVGSLNTTFEAQRPFAI